MQKKDTAAKLLSGLIVLFFACQSALAADDPDHELNFGGDIRARYEPLIQKGTATRHRERIRVRFNLTGKLSDEISGGLSLATGSLDEPISTNQTLTGFFNRKAFALDRAYVTYRPEKAQFLKFDVGKFPFPWYRTGLTFDSDINPEGFAETLSFDVNSASLKNISFVAFQLPMNETSTGHDSFVLGGQIQTRFRINSRLHLSLYGAGINFSHADPIAAAYPGTSNTYVTDAGGTVTGFAGKFAYLDAILKLEMDTDKRFPTTILFDFVNNVRGSRERSGYWAEVTFGRNKEAGDIQFGYTFVRIEKDAVIAAFNDSDLRASTNVRNHRLSFAYAFKDNLSGHFTSLLGTLANPSDNLDLVPSALRGTCSGAGTAGCDPLLKRLQCDLIYRF